ncbi:hypothetical protein FNF27_07677 [Cafeteria roenbergensis]|uniref:PKD/REJ-like domain-containing protein n=1 Tax=Cafeteria roenbergensis TaxID=33653 RepID=A0A5A8DIH5_CAFRO|nr:hypothetical protein FNF27_07677 [Cafeteria roenbergensis]
MDYEAPSTTRSQITESMTAEAAAAEGFLLISGMVCVAVIDDDVDSRPILSDEAGLPVGPQSSVVLEDALSIRLMPCGVQEPYLAESVTCDPRYDTLAESGFERSVSIVVEDDDEAAISARVVQGDSAQFTAEDPEPPVPALHEDGSGNTSVLIGVRLTSRPTSPVTVALTDAIKVCRLPSGRQSRNVTLCASDADCASMVDTMTGASTQGECSASWASVVTVTPSSAVVGPSNWSMPDYHYDEEWLLGAPLKPHVFQPDVVFTPKDIGTLAPTADLAAAWPGAFTSSALAVRVTDDDAAGVLVSATSSSTVAEGVPVVYTIVLSSQPRGAVVVNVEQVAVLAGSRDVAATGAVVVVAEPKQLVFGGANWSTPRNVSVRMLRNFVDEGSPVLNASVKHAVGPATTDAVYSALQAGVEGAPADAAFTVLNDDVAGVVLSFGGVASGQALTLGQAVPVIATISSQPLSPALSIEFMATDQTGAASSLAPARLLFTGAAAELQTAFGDVGASSLSAVRQGLGGSITVLSDRNAWTQSTIVGFVAPAAVTAGLRLSAVVTPVGGADAQYDGITRWLNVSLSQSVVPDAPTGALLYTASGIVPSVEEASGAAATPVAEVLVNVAAIPSGCLSGAPATEVSDTTVSVLLADGHCRCDGVDRFDLPCSTGSSASEHSLVFGSCGGCSSTASPAKEQCVPGKQLRLEAGGLVSEDAALSGNTAGVAPLDLSAASSGVGVIRVSAVDDDADEGRVHMSGLSLVVVTGDSCGELGQAFPARAVSSIAVRVTDNDLAGLRTQVSNSEAAEGGTGATYTLRLSAAPEAAVVVVPAVTLAASGVALPPGQAVLQNASGHSITSIVLDADNWEAGVSVTVLIGDDDIDMGSSFDVTVVHALESADPRFTGDALTQTDVTVTVSDNDVAAVTMQLLSSDRTPVATDAGLLLIEGDANASAGFIRVSLATAPSVPQASIQLRLSASAAIFVRSLSGVPTVAPAVSVALAPGQRSIDVPIANLNDDVDEADEPSVQVTVAADPSALAPEYASLADSQLAQPLSLVDDDVFAVLAAFESASNIGASAGPAAAKVFRPGGEVAEQPAYTSDAGDEVTEGASGSAAVVLVFVKLQAAPPVGQSVHVRLSTGGNPRLAAIAGADALAAGGSTTGAAMFNAGNWNVPQAIAISSDDDSRALRRGTSEFSSSDPSGTFEMVRVQLSVDPELSTADRYVDDPAGTVAAVVKRNDDDRNTVLLLGIDGSPLPSADAEGSVAASLTEGTSDSATEVLVALAAQPLGAGGITVTLAALSSRVRAVPSTVTLTADNWQAGESVRVEAADDALSQPDRDNVVLVAEATAGEDFELFASATSSVDVYDDDSAVPMINGAMPGDVLSTSLLEGTTTAFNLTMGAAFPGSAPIFAVVSAFAADGGAGVSVSPTTSFLTFTASGDAGAQGVLVSAEDDQMAGEGSASICVLLFASEAAAFGSNPNQQCFTVTVRDDSDVAGLSAAAVEDTFASATAAVAGNILAGGSLVATETIPGLLSVRLTSMPRGVVSLSLAVRSATESVVGGDPVAIAESGIAVSPDSLTFTPNNWDVPVFVEATSTSDGVVGAVRSAQIAASVAAPQDSEYDSLPELSASLRVDDVDGLESSAPVVRAVSGQAATLVDAASGVVTVVAAEGSSVVVGVRLAARPMVGVEVVLSASNTETDTVSHSLPAAGLVFGRDSWQTEQTFTVTVANDDVARNYVAALVVTATARGVGSGANVDVSDLWTTSQTAVNLAVENDDDAEIVVSSLAAPAVSVPVGGSLELTAAKVVTVTPSGTTAATCGITALVTASDASEFAVGSAARLGSTAGPSTSATGITVSVISAGLTTSASTIRLTEGGAAGSYTVGLVSSDVGGSVALTATPSSGVGLASPYANLVLTGDASFALSSAALTRAVQFAAANDDRAFALRVVTVSHAFTPEGAAASTMEVTVLVEDFEDAPGCS